MALSLQECIDKIKKEYPDHYPYAYIENEGKYVFSLIAKGENPNGAISDMHVVDPEKEYISGSIPVIEFLKNAKFREAWKHANLVANHDESIGHSAIKSSRERGWSVRRNQNGRTDNSRPFLNASSARTLTTDDLTYGGTLMHHGIKGQAWGVRNGPPYPLNKETHDKVVKGSTNGGGNVGLKNVGDGRTGMIAEVALLSAYTLAPFVSLAYLIYTETPQYKDRKQNKIQKEYNTKNRELSHDLIGDIADVGKDYSDDNPPKMIEGKHSIDDDLAACNPRFKDGSVPGTSSNCTLCAFTYDLRRRGYDVTALSSKTGNYPTQIIKSLYEGAKAEHFPAKNFNQLFDQMVEKYPEGARGELGLAGPFIGHSVAWEIRNGKVEVLDPQRNDRYTAAQLVEYGFSASHEETKVVRTDNLKVNLSGINTVSAEFKPGWKKTIDAERKAMEAAKKDRTTRGMPKLTDAQRRKQYEEAYLKEHPNADRNSEGLKNYVDAQMNR